MTFTSAGVDMDIAHTLNPTDPENVRFLIISRVGDASIYRDSSASRKLWQATHIWLRADAACTARLLLFLERE